MTDSLPAPQSPAPDATKEQAVRLRSAAEAEAQARLARATQLGASERPAEEVMHELLVMQIELEMQNEELRRAQQALEESRDRYVELYEFAPVGYFTLTADGQVLEVNLTGATLLGRERKEMRQRRFARFVIREDSERFHQLFTSVVRGETHQASELALVRGDGSVFDGRLDCVCVVADGKPPIVRITLTDISDRKQAQEALQRLNENLEAQVAERTRELRDNEEQLRQSQKMEALGQLTGGIAHDFNNLLQSIVGTLELVQRRVKQGKTDDVERHLSGAMNSANRAAALTHRLLAFSRRQPLDPKPVEPNPLIMSMEDLLRRTLGEKIELKLVLDDALWLTLCDAHQLESSLLNLVINARDAMPHGGTLTIESVNATIAKASPEARELTPGQYVCLCVTDTGTGMTAGIIERAFEPFFTTKPLGQGTGLGLSMIYGFAKQSGGHAKIDSEIGKGTTVKLYLPRFFGGAPERPLTVDHEGGRRSEPGETVLIVEDESPVRDLIRETLHDLGYRTLEAFDGPSGLKRLLSDERIDLLVTDVGLPGLNGRQMADAARFRRPELRVMFMTGYADNAMLTSEFLPPGMTMMTKPFSLEEFAARIRTIME